MDRVCGEKSRSMERPDQCCLTVEIAKLAERWYRIEVLNSKRELIQRALTACQHADKMMFPLATIWASDER
jgi:hypothetical protein